MHNNNNIDKLNTCLDYISQLLKNTDTTISPPHNEEPEDFHLIPVKDDGYNNKTIYSDYQISSSVSSVLNNTRVNGLLRISKHTIWDLELAIVENEVFRSSFMLDKRWNLLQIHDLQLSVKILVKEINHTIQVLKKLEQYDKDLIISQMKKLLDRVIQADSRISLPAHLSLRSHTRSRLRTIFDPPLPSNYLINVYVLNGNFCVDLNVLEPVKSLQSSSNSSFLRSSGIFFDNMSKSSSKHSIISEQLSHPVIYQDGKVDNASNKKCTYEIGDEFHHPYDRNNKHRVVKTIQLYTNLPWLVLCQNNLKLAKNELLYYLQKLERDEDI